MTNDIQKPRNAERGTTLLELMVSLVVLSVGVLGVSQLFPTGTRVQVQDRIRTEASQYSREKIEQLRNLDPNGPDLTVGRHGTEALGDAGSIQRYYDVEAMASPLDNLKRITVSITWKHVRACTLQAVTYLGQ
jgi:prepilin-type N-terminal cleavage/methylation domain-containing protein